MSDPQRIIWWVLRCLGERRLRAAGVVLGQTLVSLLGQSPGHRKLRGPSRRAGLRAGLPASWMRSGDRHGEPHGWERASAGDAVTWSRMCRMVSCENGLTLAGDARVVHQTPKRVGGQPRHPGDEPHRASAARGPRSVLASLDRHLPHGRAKGLVCRGARGVLAVCPSPRTPTDAHSHPPLSRLAVPVHPSCHAHARLPACSPPAPSPSPLVIAVPESLVPVWELGRGQEVPGCVLGWEGVEQAAPAGRSGRSWAKYAVRAGGHGLLSSTCAHGYARTGM